jgi:hypothetical protein
VARHVEKVAAVDPVAVSRDSELAVSRIRCKPPLEQASVDHSGRGKADMLAMEALSSCYIHGG